MGEELHSLLQPRHLPPIQTKRTSEGIPDRTLASQNPLSRDLSWFVCFLYSLRNSWPTRTETPSSVTCWVPPLWRGTSASILRTGAAPLPWEWSSGDAEQVWATHAFPQSTKPAQCYSISRLLLAFYDISIWGRGFVTSSSPSWSFTMTVSPYPFSKLFDSSSKEVIQQCSPHCWVTRLLAAVYKRYATAENDLLTSCCQHDFKGQKSCGIHHRHWNLEPTAERSEFYRHHIKRSEDAEHWKQLSGRDDQSNQCSLQFWIQACCGHQSVLAYPDSRFHSCLSVGSLSARLGLVLSNATCWFILKASQVFSRNICLLTSCCRRDSKRQESRASHHQHCNIEPTKKKCEPHRHCSQRCEDAEHWRQPLEPQEFWDVGGQSNQLSTSLDLVRRNVPCCFIHKPGQVFLPEQCPFRRPHGVTWSRCYSIWASRHYQVAAKCHALAGQCATRCGSDFFCCREQGQ